MTSFTESFGLVRGRTEAEQKVGRPLPSSGMSGGGTESSDSAYILNTEPTGLADKPMQG